MAPFVLAARPCSGPRPAEAVGITTDHQRSLRTSHAHAQHPWVARRARWEGQAALMQWDVPATCVLLSSGPAGTAAAAGGALALGLSQRRGPGPGSPAPAWGDGWRRPSSHAGLCPLVSSSRTSLGASWARASPSSLPVSLKGVPGASGKLGAGGGRVPSFWPHADLTLGPGGRAQTMESQLRSATLFGGGIMHT